MATDIDRSARDEWRDGWKVVVAAVAGMMLATLHAYSTGVMVGPLEREFGWGRAQITSGMMISSVFSVIFAPFFGMFIDRFGPRRIALFGMSLYCLALAMLSRAGPGIASWWLLWTFLSVALLSVKPTVWIAAVSGLFNRHRGVALAFVLAATGLSQAFTPAIALTLVEKFGWRTAYLTLGAGAAVLALPILWFWFSSAQDRSRLAIQGSKAKTGIHGVSARDGFRSATFARLAFGALAMGAVGGALTVNLVPILVAAQLSKVSAVSLAGLSGISAIAGRLAAGVLLDRFNARRIGGLVVLLPIATCAILLAAPGNLPLAMVGVFLSGLAAGAEMDAIAYMTTRSFGLRNFGLLFGTLSGLIALGIGSGPTLANLVYDQTGSYTLVLWAIIPLSAITAWMFFSVGPYPNFAGERTDRPA